ncbi:MAG: arginine--tRNA ligase, partial [Stellaceae bacterium]
MNLFTHFLDRIRIELLPALIAEDKLPRDITTKGLTVEPPRDPKHGDISTNAALVIANSARMRPRDLADLLAAKFRGDPDVSKVEVAGPGFVNLTLRDAFWHERLRDILRAGPHYGDSDLGRGLKINIEFVSANPTGPMHVGHGRGAVVGDALAALLQKTGFEVSREYYVNDAGTQVDVLARSLHHDVRERLGEKVGPKPDGFYPGDYMKIIAGTTISTINLTTNSPILKIEDAWLPKFREIAVEENLKLIKDDLALLGITHETFISERRDIVENGKIE